MRKRPNFVDAKQRLVHARARRLRWLRLRNHPFIVPVTTFLVLFFVTAVAFIALGASTVGASDSRLVQLAVDGKTRIIPTRATTVGDLLQRLDISVRDQDLVEPAQDTPILQNNLQVNVYRARPVTIIDKGKSTTVLSPYQDPRVVAEKAGFALFPEDDVKFQAPELKEDVIGQKVIITRATPITINLYGNVIPARTLAKTVREALKDKSVQTLPGDTITPAPDTLLLPDMAIFIVRVGKQVITQQEDIPMPVQTVTDATVPSGQTVIRQAGSAGRKLVTYEVETHNGQEVSRRVLQEVIATQPVPQIVAKGTKVTLTGDKGQWLAASRINSGDYSNVDYVIGHESGWRPGAISANRCYGLGQSCSGSLSSACPDWANDPVCQLNFFDSYAKSRYGGWAGAANFWSANRWW